MSLEKFLNNVKEYFVEKIPLTRTAKTIQILLIRETHDYTIFRTEETRELNIVTLPRSMSDPTPTIRVVMLASKQKAPENRKYIELVRTLALDYGINLDDKQKNCALKDALCMKCPRCVLFGAVSTEAGAQRWNIKHRIEYSSAYSLEDYEEISELITFNAVDSRTQSTGQALGVTENIRPIAHFPSIITLNTVTKEEFIMVLKTILATRSYGAETRIKGDMVNHIVGIVFAYEELLTSLEFLLELADKNWKDDIYEAVSDVLKEYKKNAVFPDKVVIWTGDELRKFLEELHKFEINKEFVEKLYTTAKNFVEQLEAIGKEGKKSKK